MWTPIRAWALAGALVASPLLADAQRVSGVLNLPGGGRATGGILVVATDAEGAEVVRAVTSEAGRFALPLPRAGNYRIEALRVGFAPFVLEERAFAGGETVAIDTVLPATVTTLPLRGSTPPSSCGRSPEGKEYVAMLLEEARKALLATQIGVSRQGVSARWASTDYRLASNGRDTSRFSIARKSGNLLAAFGTPVLGDIQRGGYVVIAGRDRIFRGLDLGALLSPWFQESYCFTAREGSPLSFELAFEPKERKRDYIDIEGTMTLARATLELLAVDYLYVGLPAQEDHGDAGGRLTFARTEGGSWLVDEWAIRLAQVGLMELETFRAQDRARLLQHEVLGHEIIRFQTTALLEGTRRIYLKDAVQGEPPGGLMRTLCTERIVATPTGAARGKLTLDGRPVSGSRIQATWRVGLDIGGEEPLWRDEIRETTSSNRGDWVLCDLPAGTSVTLSWEVMGRRSSSSLRVERGEVVTVGPDGTVER